ncbi:MAG: hypothetical protein FIB01_12485 [Gemmatimonadetes bacterium]|nr:hypothetical protein [Gemmatimonadota bacterium]
MSQQQAVALKVLEPNPAAADEARAPHPAPGMLVGICVSDAHPTLRGRVHIRWMSAEGEAQDAWLPQVQGVVAREGDRVLLASPSNHDEQIVIGVLDGLGANIEVPASERGPLLQLAPDEALRIAGPDGQPILEVKVTPTGPEVRLFVPAEGLQLPGAFRVSAEEIELQARNGELRIDAAGDVKVAGEIIRLN